MKRYLYSQPFSVLMRLFQASSRAVLTSFHVPHWFFTLHSIILNCYALPATRECGRRWELVANGRFGFQHVSIKLLK